MTSLSVQLDNYGEELRLFFVNEYEHFEARAEGTRVR